MTAFRCLLSQTYRAGSLWIDIIALRAFLLYKMLVEGRRIPVPRDLQSLEGALPLRHMDWSKAWECWRSGYLGVLVGPRRQIPPFDPRRQSLGGLGTRSRSVSARQWLDVAIGLWSDAISFQYPSLEGFGDDMVLWSCPDDVIR